MSIQSIYGQVRKQMSPDADQFEVGHIVVARFTNSGRVFRFEGIVRGRTKNYWKVETITSPYENEKPGRVFHIATIESRIYSSNNRIVGLSYKPVAKEAGHEDTSKAP